MVETVFALAVMVQLLVPGWIFKNTRRRFFVVETETHPQETLIGFAVTSLVVLSITWPLFAFFGFDPLGSLVASNDATVFLAAISAHPLRWFLQLVIAPTVLSVFCAYVERQAWGSEVFSKIGLPPLPSRPTALTAAVFHHRQSDAIIEVLLKDGTRVIGRLGPDSAVNSGKGYPDIFMDATYLLASDGSWSEDEESSGMVVMGSEIRLIQFFLNPEITGEADEEEEVPSITDEHAAATPIHADVDVVDAPAQALAASTSTDA